LDSGAATSYKGRVKVLVVEDKKKIASFVRNGLEGRGVVVDVCHRGDEGNELATTRCYDVILLDIMLPGRECLSILRILRERSNAVPVILLAAQGDHQAPNRDLAIRPGQWKLIFSKGGVRITFD
jgi:DNA-binding response OmpR family regulator